MPTTRRFFKQGFVSSSNQWDEEDSGDVLQWIFSEGAWVPQWQGSYIPHIIPPLPVGGFIVVGLTGAYWEVPQPELVGTPPIVVSQAFIQALIDTPGTSVLSIGGSISGAFDARVSVVGGGTVTTLDELNALQWIITVLSSGPTSPTLRLTFASGNLTLEVPDTQTVEITGEGGAEVGSAPGGGAGLLLNGTGPDPGGLLIGSAPGAWGGVPTIQIVDHSGQCALTFPLGTDSGGGSGCQEPSA